MRTIIVRTGVSDDTEVTRFLYRPTTTLDSVAELAGRVHDPFNDNEA